MALNPTSSEKSEAIEEVKGPLLRQSDDKEPIMLCDLKLDGLTNIHIYAYGVGHFLNDLCAACWFNYLLFYLKSVSPIGNAKEAGTYAGIVLLAGQLADGIFTPIVGFSSDKFNTRCGKRMPWYYFGFVMVCICFYFIFIPCQFCVWFGNTTPVRLLYYIIFPSLFNVGWAACQVSHMSLVPSMTISRVRRDVLNNLRNTFTFIANFWVLLFAFFLFALVDNSPLKFRILAQGTLVLGASTSIFFMLVIREKSLTRTCRKLAKEYREQLSRIASQVSLPKSLTETEFDGLDSLKQESEPHNFTLLVNEQIIQKDQKDTGTDSSEKKKVVETTTTTTEKKIVKVNNMSSLMSEAFHWYLWFYEWKFYAYGFVYMGARVYCNVITSLLLFYLQTVLRYGYATDVTEIPITFAIIPMLIYISSSVLTIKLKNVYQKIGRKKSFTIGAVLALGISVALVFLEPSINYFMYLIAILLGLAQSLILNTAIAFIGEVVGQKGGSGAFVYGFYSLMEKTANGVILFLVMHLNDVTDTANTEYVRWCFVLAPCVAAVVAWVGVQTGGAQDYEEGADDVVRDNRKSPE